MAASTLIETQLVEYSFSTELGWLQVLFQDDMIARLWFGYRNKTKLPCSSSDYEYDSISEDELSEEQQRVVELLTQYAAGEPVDLNSIKIDLSNHTDFQRKVVKACRNISYGQTASYGELAKKAGSPNAARAVGSTMAKNVFPLIVPCHRVVGSTGALHGFSAPDGLNMKSRLLKMES